MRHHVQEKRRQRSTSNATSDSDRMSVQETHHAPWQTTLDEEKFNRESTPLEMPPGGSSVVCSRLVRRSYLQLRKNY